MLSTNKTCLPPKLDLPNATSMHWGHLDTYICYHITLTFSKVFIRLTTIKTTNCTCNTQSKIKIKINRQCNISNVAKLFDSTYEISHLILQYFRQSIHRKADTRQSLWITSLYIGNKGSTHACFTLNN